MSRIEAVCFDLGGVLVDIRHNWRDVFEAIGQSPRSCPETLGDLELFVDYQNGLVATCEFFERLSQEFGLDGATARAAHLAILKGPFSGSQETVEALASTGLSCGVLSNTNEAHWGRLTDPAYYPYVRSMKAQLASHILMCSKPGVKTFREFEAAIGANGSAILYFDDSLTNIDAAIAMGWNGRHIRQGVDPITQIQATIRELGLVS